MTAKSDVEELFVKLGCKASVNSFDSRIKLQKLAYLSGSFGISLGFNFSWYVYGPYSPQLTKVMFDKEIGEPNNINDISNAEDSISKLKEFLKDDIDSADSLELIASLHYICSLYEKPKDDKSEIISVLRSAKPRFPEEMANNYLEKVLTLF